jgi:hypothetical protein
MVRAVIADFHTGRLDLGQDLRGLFDPASEDEEGGRRPALLQQRQQPGGVGRGAVIEGQGQTLVSGAVCIPEVLPSWFRPRGVA